jgi:hypothetical protein
LWGLVLFCESAIICLQCFSSVNSNTPELLGVEPLWVVPLTQIENQ